MASRPAPVPGSGPGQGPGSLPGPVLFEPGLTGMDYADHTRSAIRIRTNSWAVTAVEMNRCNGSDRTVATIQSVLDIFTPPGVL